MRTRRDDVIGDTSMFSPENVDFNPWNTRRGRAFRRRRTAFRTASASVAVIVLATFVWWVLHRPDMCSPNVERIDHECIGVTDDHSFVPGRTDPLERVRNAIKAENDWVDHRHGRPVTVAFLGPLTDNAPTGVTGGRITHELEGAYIAQHRLNHGPLAEGQRLIKLKLANEGRGEHHWKDVVNRLVGMKDDDNAPLVAVIGLVLSQDETARAALELSRHHVPMVGDITTADGLDATGTALARLNRGRPERIGYLARIAIPNDQQIHAVADYVHTQRKDLHSAVMLTDLNGSDMYNTSLRADYERYFGAEWKVGHLADDPFLGTGDLPKDLRGAIQDFCGPERADLVLFAGRANALNAFIEELRQYQTQQGQACKVKPITIVTGSDAAVLSGGKARPAESFGRKSGQFTVLYVPLADPYVLSRSANREPFEEFRRAFTLHAAGDDPKTTFQEPDLNDGWAIDAHDAMMTAGTVIRANDSDPDGPPPRTEDVLVALRQLQHGRQVAGAVTARHLDANGNAVQAVPPTVMRVDR